MRVSLFGNQKEIRNAFSGSSFPEKKIRSGMKYKMPESYTEAILGAMEKGTIRMAQIRVKS